MAIDLLNLIDLHIHTAPDIVPRSVDDVQAARQAQAAGMRAILIKSHLTLTADRAMIAEQVVSGQPGGIRVFGGLALNNAVGGLNPAAVESALRLGARQIWFPTRPPIAAILDEQGRLLPPVVEILALVRSSEAVLSGGPAILSSGHLSPQDTVVLFRAAVQMGVQRLLVTHPDSPSIAMPLDMQLELAGFGVRFERCFLPATRAVRSPIPLEQIAQAIRAIGVKSTILSTDFGQASLAAPVDGLRDFLQGLMRLGFAEKELGQMAGAAPAEWLGLA